MFLGKEIDKWQVFMGLLVGKPSLFGIGASYIN